MGKRNCVILLTLWLLGLTISAAPVTFDGGVTYQVIDGFGVNVNHRSWHNDELKPVLDAFIDQAGMTLFRVVFDQSDWETNNDNADPNVMNWGYYNTVYGSATFAPLWDLMGHLNSKGITNGAFFCFMGSGPSWLGGHGISSGLEPEWAEMITSLLYYARNTQGIGFNLVAPDNEPDQWSEGIQITSASQYVTALQALAQRLDANGLSDVRFIGPDYTSGGTTYMPQMLANSVAMDKLGHWGVHPWGAPGSSGVYDFVRSSAYPNLNFWVTEFNASCAGCETGTRGTYDWDYCEGTAAYLMQYLADGASAGIVWEGYDSYYLHSTPSWSYWGLFGVDDEKAAVKTYTARKNFYTVAQVSKWVRPGAQRIGVSGSVSSLSPLLAFKHEGLGQITIVGINTAGSAVTLSGELASLPTVSQLDLYYTSATANLANGGSVAVNNGSFNATIPADCVFTLTGFTGVNVTLTSPVNGAQFNAPATIPLAATATSTAGSISLVRFYNGVTELGESRIAPYTFVWNDVPMGNYALSAVASDNLGNISASAVVSVTVVGPLAQIGVTPANATVVPGGKQQFSAVGADPLGHALVPQPAFVWSVSGGGTIDETGLFTAASVVGGSFDVVAVSGAYAGTASVSVAAASAIGNTNEGTATDMMWNNGAWINASRFQAASNMMVSTMCAKVRAISGGYKCAIYSDNRGNATTLLGTTEELRGCTNGWNVFQLTLPVTLTNGQYYWLAIWSDDTESEVYYSDISGTACWGRYNYGAWPDPIAITGRGNLDYCIWARGGSVPMLASVAVTPTDNVLWVGSPVQFVATGTYSDGSVRDVTSQATWTSSSTAVVAINSGGLAVAISPGTATISAALNGVAGFATFRFEALPLAITTTFLAAGAVNVPYAATLIPSGGTAPHAWSITDGFLPDGLILNAGSASVTGTPATIGTFIFTAQVADSSQPVQTASQSLSITILSVPEVRTIWPVTTVPGSGDVGAAGATELGVKFRSDVAGTISGIRFYKASANTGSHVGNLWTSTGGLLATATFTSETATGWQQVDFATPVAISANTTYVASYHVQNGHFSADANTFSAVGVDNVPLHALANSVAGGNGVYRGSYSSAFPNLSGEGTNYWVDVVFRGLLKLNGAVVYYPRDYPPFSLSGEVVSGVALNLTGDTNVSGATIADGTYGLSNLPVGGTYCVTPSKTDDSAPVYGVTVADLAMVQARILGKLPLGPYQLLAADVNNSGNVTVADLALIQAMILGRRNNFPAGMWRFVPADYVFPDPLNPWRAPGQAWYTNQMTDVTNVDFVAIKLGDVNGSWKAPASGLKLASASRNKGASLAAAVPEVGFGVGQESAPSGQTVTVEVAVNGFHRVTSVQFSLEWDPGVLRYLGTGRYGLQGLSSSCFGTTMTASGKLGVGWYDPDASGVTLPDGTGLFKVSFEVVGKPGSSSTVRLTDAPTPEEVSVDFALASFGSKDGSVMVVGPEVPSKQLGYVMGVFQLSVSTQKGLFYTLEYTDTLAPAKWKAQPTVVGDGTVTVLRDLAATNQQRFYRVRVE
jgi:O-glycosyl hydrolase